MTLQHEEQQQQQQWIEGPIIIGGGPSGLATAASLKNQNIPSLILERSNCIASLWQNKAYDRLKLHLPKPFCQLPLKPFPQDQNLPKYPTKEHFISYLESYASFFDLKPHFNENVESAEFDTNRCVWVIRTRDRIYCSKWLVVASGENADPRIPEINGAWRFEGKILHSSEYRCGRDYEKQKVLVIGCGNSGMEVALDLCGNHACTNIVVRNTVHVLPREVFGLSTFGIAMGLMKWLPLRLLDILLLLLSDLTLGHTGPLGLPRPKIGPIEHKNVTGKSPVLDVGTVSQIKSGNIKVMKSVKEITRNGAKFEDGQEKEFDAIIFATGYKSNVTTWLKEDGDSFTEAPETEFSNNWKRKNGLYMAGFSKRGLVGSSSDATNIARDIAEKWRANHDL